jgi:hypothetical protein
MKEKYITIDLSSFNKLWKEFSDRTDISPSYWVPERFLLMINFLEEKFPDYKYSSFNPAGSGGYQPFIVMKLKS